MTRLSLLTFFALAIAACSQEPNEPELPVFDVLLVGGTLYDGNDSEAVAADVGIIDDRIVAIGSLADREASRTIDVTGLAVAPGFIDIHNHAVRTDPTRGGIFKWPAAENLIRQGVTTAVGGPDGGSPLPLSDTFARLVEVGTTVNFASFVGHGSVRELVVGQDDRPATTDEMQKMREIVADSMEQGAFGLSSGLLYAPGSFAPTEEVIELAKVAARYDGIYISHMRNEGTGLLKSVKETIQIGEKAGLPTQITHHKVMGKPMWGSASKSLALVDAAIARGVDVSSDQYPYAASSTGLTALFPRWARDGDRETRLARYKNREQRALLKNDIVINMKHDRGGDDPARVAIAYCSWDPSLNGLNLADILRLKEREVNIDNAAELVIEMQAAGGCSAVYHAMDIDDVLTIMNHPKTMIASDGGVEAPSDRMPHPRNYGAFARVLGYYVREQNVMPLHTAIHKMTMMPAGRMGLSDRGRLTIGAIADVTVFDPDTIIDKATFENPHQYAVGTLHVFVNGEQVLSDGEMTDKRPGKVIRSR